jgi:hypothetical protein
MPSITYISKYKKNTGLVLSPTEVRDLYFFGIDIVDGSGNEIPDTTIRFYIEAAQKEIENRLKIKFKKQLFEESCAYFRDNYINNLPRVQTRYPVNEGLSLTGYYKKVEQISFPKEWLSSSVNSDGIYSKRLSIVPSAGSAVGTSQDVIFTGITTSYFGSLGRFHTLPDYWTSQYVTGFDVDHYPSDLINVVGMLSTIPVLAIAGDLILGAGIASQSLSMDGLSQSISSTSSATNSGYGSRIIEYRKTIDLSLKQIEKTYKGFNFNVF